VKGTPRGNFGVWGSESAIPSSELHYAFKSSCSSVHNEVRDSGNWQSAPQIYSTTDLINLALYHAIASAPQVPIHQRVGGPAGYHQDFIAGGELDLVITIAADILAPLKPLR
jgi:hypothetical protein